MVRKQHTVWALDDSNNNAWECPAIVPPRSILASVRPRFHHCFAVTNGSHSAHHSLVGTLSNKQLKCAMDRVPAWKRKANVIRRTFEFKDFPVAVRFVNAVARLAEKSWHHPDIDIRWNQVTLALTTHDEGGLTEKDFSLAEQFDALAGTVIVGPGKKKNRTSQHQ